MKKILVKLLASNGLQRGIMLGIARYCRLRGPFRVVVAADTLDIGIFDHATVDDPDIDGILMAFVSHQQASEITARNVPAVCMTYLDGVPMVSNDNTAVGRMGAEHLISQGYKHLVITGPAIRPYQLHRIDGFTAQAKAAGVNVRVLELPPGSRNIDAIKSRLAKLAESIDGPIALMADSDVQAYRVAEAAAALDLQVPERLAILGVENEQPICEITTPPLSSVALNAERIGYEGAAMLDCMMNGRAPAAIEVQVPPVGICQRRSTAALVIEDRQVAAALNFIRQNPSRALTTQDILGVVDIGRRALERRFVDAIGLTIFQEVRRVQLEHVKRLLRETSWDIEILASRSAFSSAKRLREVFKEAFDISPSEYRQSRQSPAAELE